MKRNRLCSVFVLCLVLIPQIASSDIPDPVYCSVEPWDSWGAAFVTPGNINATDPVTIIVRNSADLPIANATVTINLSECQNLCIDPINSGLVGTTNAAGVVVLNPLVGGCEDCNVIVMADVVPIGSYYRIRSTDFSGARGDGIVNAVDLAFFAAAFNATQYICADYDNSGWVGPIDLLMFAQSFLGMTVDEIPDTNPGGCQ